MKINPLLGAVPFPNLVGSAAVARDNARTERDGENGRDQYSRQNKDQDHEESSSEDDYQTHQQRMEEELDAFSRDPQAKASGLSAVTEGRGPGLKVVVKDSGGGTVRQFTGEEFLKLREAVGHDRRARGKILDQKA